MVEKYKEACMKFSNEELKRYFIDMIRKGAQSDVPEDSNYKRYNYYEPHMFIVNVENDPIIGKTKIYENITINY